MLSELYAVRTMYLKDITLLTFAAYFTACVIVNVFPTSFLAISASVLFFVSVMSCYCAWAFYISGNVADRVKDRKKMKVYGTVYLAGLAGVAFLMYSNLLTAPESNRHVEFVGIIVGWVLIVTFVLMLNSAAYLISLKENAPGADRTNNRIVTIFKLFMIPFFMNDITKRIGRISSKEQKS